VTATDRKQFSSRKKERGTLCVSSQVGCTLNCDFCSTGKQGFSRNLTSAEIISQVWIAARSLSLDKIRMIAQSLMS